MTLPSLRRIALGLRCALAALGLHALTFGVASSQAQTQTAPFVPTAPVPAAAPVSASTTSQPAPLVSTQASQQSPTTLLQYQTVGSRPPPFGSEMFATPNVTASLNILDPGYIMKPGDHITLSVYGGLPDQTQDLVVDTKGNIVVPGVGPVQVAGLTASAVNGVVNGAASAIFSSAVKVYASPTTTALITVFVTGPVKTPGPYQGASTDSVLAYLQRAGGIDPIRGSYRNIIVRRAGQTIAHVDLYGFLRTGEMKPLRLREGDVIVVGQQGPIVSVYGSARAPFTFELAQASGTGEEVLYYARPQPQTNYAGVLGVRETKPYNVYLALGDFAREPLRDGDRVAFAADTIADTVVVEIEGAHAGPSSYVVPRQTSLAAVLARIPLDSMADRHWIHLKRVSVAVTEKQLLNESLSRLEKAIYTQNSSTEGVAQANAAQAQAIQQYIDRAKQIQPQGNVALPPGADLSRVSLEPDDTIVIPYQSQVVAIGGEVTQPQALIYEPGVTAEGYVRRAGGFSDLANKGHILIIHPDGTTQVNGYVQPGDRILVLTHLSGKYIQLVKDLTQILYQLAIAAVAVNRF